MKDGANEPASYPHSPADLQQLYARRFEGKSAYRRRVWNELCSYFSRWIPESSAVLDLGCGHCEFINAVRSGRKFGMDLNPDARQYASGEVTLLQQDCSEPWQVPDSSLDVVFTSNFFEHLPSKIALERTIKQAHRALVPGGRLIAMGPNIKYTGGAYWDFFDHHLPLTESALIEVCSKLGFQVEFCRDRFLPYTMSDGNEYPIWMLQLYLRLPVSWRFFGKQFLLVVSKAA